jgi:acetoin utilization deacetylase AcuC-like enzyme
MASSRGAGFLAGRFAADPRHVAGPVAARQRAARHSGNRLVSLLEGGYDLQGLAFSVAAHVGRLMKG